jgi:hypothetical protein
MPARAAALQQLRCLDAAVPPFMREFGDTVLHGDRHLNEARRNSPAADCSNHLQFAARLLTKSLAQSENPAPSRCSAKGCSEAKALDEKSAPWQKRSMK